MFISATSNVGGLFFFAYSVMIFSSEQFNEDHSFGRALLARQYRRQRDFFLFSAHPGISRVDITYKTKISSPIFSKYFSFLPSFKKLSRHPVLAVPRFIFAR